MPSTIVVIKTTNEITDPVIHHGPQGFCTPDYENHDIIELYRL